MLSQKLHEGGIQIALIKCPECGREISDTAEKCPNCGYPLIEETPYPISTEEQETEIQKDRNTALILCIFLGCFGAHKFYEGKIGIGILYLFTGGLFCAGWIIDIIDIARKPEKYFVLKKEAPTEKQNRTQHFQETDQKPNKKKMYCKRCGGTDISVQLDNVITSYELKSETRKKGALTNIGNSAGRAGMVLLTGGLWALTPKKSKYKETQTGSVKTKQIKTAICQECGRTWRVYW